MTLSVAGQSGIVAPTTQLLTPFFDKKQAVTINDGKLVVDKQALGNRLAAAPVGNDADRESILKRIIEAIRAFIRSVFRLFKSDSGVRSAADDGNVRTSGRSDDSDVSAPRMTESDSAITADNLPVSVLERVQKTLNEMIDSAVGQHLPDSLKAALKMPELGQKQAFRVLLQKNCTETQQMRSLCQSLQAQIDEMLVPFAEEYGLDIGGALAVFRADLEHGGGVIANMVDPKSELRAHVAELKRLESALAGQARARGVICDSALEAGVYDKDSLRELLTQQGIESDFLDVPRTAPTETESVQVPAGEEGKVVSMDAYRGKSASTAPPVPTSPVVADALDKLTEQGVVSEEQSAEIAQAAVQDQVLSAEDAFDVVADVQGDDLGDFLSKRRPKNTP